MPHPSSSQSFPISQLTAALTVWATRNDNHPQAVVRQAANVALAAIDDMLGDLFEVRQKLVREVRESDRAADRRTDALMARGRAARTNGDATQELPRPTS
jgi:hypothetical protein